MRCQALEALLFLWAAALGDAFTGIPFSFNVQKGVSSLSKTHVAMSASSQQSGFGTRGDMIKAAGVSVAGVLGSATLPAGALAAAEPERKGEVILRLAACLHHERSTSAASLCLPQKTFPPLLD